MIQLIQLVVLLVAAVMVVFACMAFSGNLKLKRDTKLKGTGAMVAGAGLLIAAAATAYYALVMIR